ncbi:STAM-binding protein-like [Apostichopus japonicus]|uniref:STAM-binding protein-like n=1 Tax=Stichopus japonicus TaxID=307972 RepID=UPI003AB1D274
MALEAQVLEPAARVRKLAEHSAEMIHVDSCVPIKRYFRSGKEMIKMANIYFEEEDWERSFVLYNKYITLFVEKLPQQHPEYNQSRTQDIKESKKTVKGAFPKAEETKLKVKEKYTAEYEKWLSEEKKRKDEEARLEEEARRREEEERLQREREAAMGEEERQTLRMERERQSLEEQQRILEQQRAAILEEQRREQLALEEEKRCWNLAGKEQRRIDAEPRNNQTEGDVTGNREPVIAPPRPSAPTVDRSLKIDRSTKPNHLAGSDVSPPLAKTNKYGFRTVMIPDDTTVRFMQLAEPYTSRNVEFCGILAGRLAQHAFTITHIVIPKQEGTSDSCTALNEEDMFDVMDSNDLITLGWIHTHPSQTAFLSSVDLHTHCPYQIMLPEALAIVCAPKHKEIGFFSLTPLHGLQLVSKCSKRGFHEHPKHPPIFESSEHSLIVRDIRIQIVDLR